MKDYISLKKSNCKSCYKCIRHCPVKSIRFSGNQAHIISDECILCGQCFVVCPQEAKVIIDSIESAKVLIQSGSKIIASIAPSFVANYSNVNIESMKKALLKLGFYDVEETAIGATMVKNQYEEIIKNGKQDVIISSCCPTVNMLVQKHFPAALPYLANVVTPMQAHCQDIKKRHHGAKTVFIGPCISKKSEADECPSDVDCVLTFEELSKWLAEEKIEFEIVNDAGDKGKARIFPTSGGIIKSMNKLSEEFTYISIDGHENCINALKDIIDGKLNKCFIEMSACSGSCTGGPVMEKKQRNPVRDYISVVGYVKNKDFDISVVNQTELTKNYKYDKVCLATPSEIEVKEILMRMGKTLPEHELNCGSCGYNSCHDKAVAVFQGKADMSMCMPFLKDKAETFSENILRNTPNGIILLNEVLEVQQINDVALRIFNIKNASDVIGEQIIRILDPTDFIKVWKTGKKISNKRIYLAEYGKYVEETIIPDKSYHVIMCIFKDVTEEEFEKAEKQKICRQTVEITDKIVEKQMRVVQEIALLLGETTAETKIALTKLKESL